MKRGGFTMIELIFVIVILGILAAVAIPKLMATRTDAKIAAITQQVQSAIGEIPAYVVSQGKVDTLTTMSQVLNAMVSQGKASSSHFTNNQMTGSNIGGSTDVLYIGTQDDNGEMEDCIKFDVNSTTLVITDNNVSGLGAICRGVTARITDQNITIAGSGVKF